MTTINRAYSIAFRGLAIGKHTFEFECDNSFFNTFSEGEFQKGECKVDVILEKGENLIILDCNIVGKVEVSCDRCLDEFMIDVDFDGKIFVKFSDMVDSPKFDDENDTESDILWLNPAEDYIDLAQYIYDSAILSLPVQRIHPLDENGESLCNKDMLSRFTIASEEDDYDDDGDDFDEDYEEGDDDGYNF